MNLSSKVLLQKSKCSFSSRTKVHLTNISTIESRNCVKNRESHFFRQKQLLNEEKTPKKPESSLSPEKIKWLMNDLGKAEHFLRAEKQYSKFKRIKERIGILEEPQHNRSITHTYRKITTKRVMTPVKIPRSGFNIDCLYKYGL